MKDNLAEIGVHRMAGKGGQGEYGWVVRGLSCCWEVTWAAPQGGSSHPPRVTDAKCNSLSPKTVCAWWRAISYARWPCYAEHSGSKGVNLEKQSPVLWCECCAYGMNGNGWVCLKRHPLVYQATSQRYLALPSIGALLGGPCNFPCIHVIRMENIAASVV
jgi:hypothetical protein